MWARVNDRYRVRALAAALAFAEDTAYPHPHPSIQLAEGVRLAVFEALKPALGRTIDVLDDNLPSVVVRALRLDADRVLGLIQALAAHPIHAPLEMASQKVKDPCLHPLFLFAAFGLRIASDRTRGPEGRWTCSTLPIDWDCCDSSELGRLHLHLTT
jgi:hypothetical protein